MKNWSLPIAIMVGIIGYILYVRIGLFDVIRPWTNEVISVVQPVLIFSMLFLTFCHVHPRELRPHRWQIWLLLIQVVSYVLLMLLLFGVDDMQWRIIIECAMLCLICPTATAGAVVTTKLGGSAAAITTYTIIINAAVAIVTPMTIPLIHPQGDISFQSAFFSILHKVFPLLICPMLLAWFVRFCMPAIWRFLIGYKDLAFYLWTLSLSIAIAVASKVIVHSGVSSLCLLGIAVATLLCCIVQFGLGKWIGGHSQMRLEGGQSLGQKNTVFVMWLGYTFFSPVTAAAGGFYSIWHNLVNSYQLYKYRKGKINIDD